jgi:hypothetical protein
MLLGDSLTPPCSTKEQFQRVESADRSHIGQQISAISCERIVRAESLKKSPSCEQQATHFVHKYYFAVETDRPKPEKPCTCTHHRESNAKLKFEA